MPMFRKKPAEVEAYRYDGSNASEIFLWVFNGKITPSQMETFTRPDGILVPSKIGITLLGVGDYIIKTGEFEFSIRRSKVFESMFEKID